jgi:hypothetical protein
VVLFQLDHPQQADEGVKVQFSLRTLLAVMLSVSVPFGMLALADVLRPQNWMLYLHCIPSTTAAVLGMAIAVFRSENCWRRTTLSGGASAAITSLALFCWAMAYIHPNYGDRGRPWYWWMSNPDDLWYSVQIVVFHLAVGNIVGFTVGQLAWWMTGRKVVA